MPVLSWEKPEQIMPKEDWLALGFDDGPPGAYVPNMSQADRLLWKAKFIGGKYLRVEIRKSIKIGYGYVGTLFGKHFSHDFSYSFTTARDECHFSFYVQIHLVSLLTWY